MPTTAERIPEFIRLVEAGRFLEAFEEYYADDVVLQENRHPPFVGKEAVREKERAFVGAIRRVIESRAVSVVVDGDDVAIHWVAEYEFVDGSHYHVDQIARQTWRDGQIVRERFFYDTGAPAQAA